MTPELLVILGSILGGTGALAVTRLSYWADWRARDKWGRSSRYRAGEYSNGNCVPLPPAPPYRRGSNPPPPGGKPAPPAGAPCNGGEITLAQWEAMRTPFTEGPVQRGNGTGGPTTPKPNIISKPQFPPPQIIREDFLP